MEHCDSCESPVHIDVDIFLYACSNYKLFVTSIVIVIVILYVYTHIPLRSHICTRLFIQKRLVAQSLALECQPSSFRQVGFFLGNEAFPTKVYNRRLVSVRAWRKFRLFLLSGPYAAAHSGAKVGRRMLASPDEARAN